MTTTAPQDVPADLGPSGTPNVYHLHGEGIRITYYPEGSGPPTADGPVELIYQDLHRTLTFRAHEVTVDQVPSLGSLVSVVVQSTPDFGSTTATVLIPNVVLEGAHSVSAHTLLITSMHSSTLTGSVSRNVTPTPSGSCEDPPASRYCPTGGQFKTTVVTRGRP